MVVVPERVEGEDGEASYVFSERGPYTLPLAIRNEEAETGSLAEWSFFTHPYGVFPPESGFYNMAGKGCLESRLSVRGDDGVRLYDEVGAGFDEAEMVPATYSGALGVLRQRALGDKELAAPYAADVVALDLDLLELFRLSTLLLHTENPFDTVLLLDRLLKRPTVGRFAKGLFDEGDQAAMQAILSEHGATREQAERFRVSEEDFSKVVDIQDARGRHAIASLLTEWESFHQEHGDRLAEIDQGIAQCEANLSEIRQRVLALQDEAARSKGSLTRRLFGRSDKQLKQLKAEAVHNLRTLRTLEAEVQEIPGYDQLKGLSDRVKGVQESIGHIYRTARDLFDHNVTQSQVRSLLNVFRERVTGEQDAKKRRVGFRNYDLRLRAEMLTKLLTTYSLSAYVLRRPDALKPESPSHRNVLRINRMAGQLIEYFRYVRYGNKTLGQTWDETWGQIVAIEAQL
jgi:hypothetical protein